jgi:hypothetical protein
VADRSICASDEISSTRGLRSRIICKTTWWTRLTPEKRQGAATERAAEAVENGKPGLECRVEARRAAYATRRANGWPERTDNQRHFNLRPYGRVYTAFVKDKGFWMRLEGNDRVVFGRDYDSALKALVRMLEPDAEEILVA